MSCKTLTDSKVVAQLLVIHVLDTRTSTDERDPYLIGVDYTLKYLYAHATDCNNIQCLPGRLTLREQRDYDNYPPNLVRDPND